MVDAVPDRSGFDIVARSDCFEGEYRMFVSVTGDGPDGRTFEFDTAGDVTPVALVQCAT